MQLHNRQVLFPLLARLDRHAVRALSSTSKTLRAACTNVCPGFWRDRLFADPELNVYRNDVLLTSGEHVCFAHYISQWLPLQMRKYHRILCTYSSDGVAITDDGTVRTWGLVHMFAISKDLLPLHPDDGSTFVHVASTGSCALYLTSAHKLILVSPLHNKFALPAQLPAVTFATIGENRALAIDQEGHLISWGPHPNRDTLPVPPPGTKFVSAVSATSFDMALCSNGTIMVWNCVGNDEVAHVPELPNGLRYIQISGSDRHACALRSDGNIVVWGQLYCDAVQRVPLLPDSVYYVQVKAASTYNVALRSDGQVVAWGDGLSFHVQDVPVPPEGYRFVEITDFCSHCVARCSDGTFHLWSNNRMTAFDMNNSAAAIPERQVFHRVYQINSQ